MSGTQLIAEELMDLYKNSPRLVLYKDDLLKTEKAQYIEEIADMNDTSNLNPIDVVLESLLNVIAEKLSMDTLTQSNNVALLDKSLQEQAVRRIVDFAKNDVSFLEQIHKKWMEELRHFLRFLSEKGTESLQEIIFQISLRFRISALSSLKAISTILK